MLKKINKIIRNFYHTLSKLEILFVTILPMVIGILTFINRTNISKDDLSNYISDINNAALSIVTLLIAFGIGAVTLLYSSSSPSVSRAKGYYPKNLTDSNNIPINYYQLIIIRIYYSLVVEIMILFSTIIIKIFFFKTNLIILVCLMSFLLVHIVIVELKIILSMYHLMWKD